jgi:hypothetical protein
MYFGFEFYNNFLEFNPNVKFVSASIGKLLKLNINYAIRADSALIIYRQKTDSISIEHAKLSTTKNLDTLYAIVITLENLQKTKTQYKEDNSLVYAISDYWLFSVNKRMEKISSENFLYKYDHRYKTIISELHKLQYHPDIHLTKFEKVLLHIKNGNFEYLVRRALN